MVGPRSVGASTNTTNTRGNTLAQAGSRFGRQGLALILVLAAAANALSALLVHPWPAATAFAEIADLDQMGWGRFGLIVSIAALLLLARASARGKRYAWLLVLGLLALSLAGALLERDALLTVLALLTLLLGTLLVARCFPRGGNRWAAVRGYAAVGIGVLLAIETIPLHHLLARPTAGLPAGSHAPLGLGFQALMALLIGCGVVEVLRPARATHLPSMVDRETAREVVRRYGVLAVHHFAPNGDKRYFWSQSGRSLIAYRLAHGVAIALGDPVGPAEEFGDVLHDFVTFCRRQDWSIAVYQASAHLRRMSWAERLVGVRIGQEAMLDLDRFTLQGKAAAPVRHAVARAQRAGLTVQCWQGEAPPNAIFAKMRRVSADWLDSQPVRTQMGFSMGRFPDDWSPDLLTVAALEPTGDVAGFLTCTPLHAGNGWACDNMRRVAAAPPGTMELLIAEAIRWARARGYAHLSLGLAPLASYECDHPSGEDTPAPPIPLAFAERSAAFLHRHGILLGHYRTLARFKAKFQPAWEPRYLLVGDIDQLPRILLALAAALGAISRGRPHNTSRRRPQMRLPFQLPSRPASDVTAPRSPA